MVVNMSNKEHNFFIISGTVLENTSIIFNSLSFFTLKSFITPYESVVGKVNKTSLYL